MAGLQQSAPDRLRICTFGMNRLRTAGIGMRKSLPGKTGGVTNFTQKIRRAANPYKPETKGWRLFCLEITVKGGGR